MENEKNNLLYIENAEIFYCNFAGREGRFNPAGKRNFCVYVPEETAAQLEADGWYVKRNTSEGTKNFNKPYIKVNVNFSNPKKVPKVEMRYTDSNKGVQLNEHTIGELDNADIANVRITVNPHHYIERDTNKDCYNGYLKSMIVTINLDPLEKEMSYRDAAESEPPFDF